MGEQNTYYKNYDEMTKRVSENKLSDKKYSEMSEDEIDDDIAMLFEMESRRYDIASGGEDYSEYDDFRRNNPTDRFDKN